MPILETEPLPPVSMISAKRGGMLPFKNDSNFQPADLSILGVIARYEKSFGYLSFSNPEFESAEQDMSQI